MKKKLHNWTLIGISCIAALMIVCGAMGLDGDFSGACAFSVVVGAAWLSAFVYANKERF